MMVSAPKRMVQAYQIYDALLHCYPPSFKEEYGGRLRLQFRDEYQDALDSGVRLLMYRFWLFIVVDFLTSFLREYEDEVVKMAKKHVYMYSAIVLGILGFLTFIFWFGPYYDMIEIGFFVELLLFPTLFMILSAITLFGLAQSTNSHAIFRYLPIAVLLFSFVFFPIPHKHPVRGWVHSTAIEYIGGNEDTAFGILFSAYFIFLLIYAILALVKKRWLPGISLLALCLPVLLPYIGLWLSIEIPFVKQGEGEWFAVAYGALSAVAWFVIAWWFYREYKSVTISGVVEAV